MGENSDFEWMIYKYRHTFSMVLLLLLICLAQKYDLTSCQTVILSLILQTLDEAKNKSTDERTKKQADLAENQPEIL